MPFHFLTYGPGRSAHYGPIRPPFGLYRALAHIQNVDVPAPTRILLSARFPNAVVLSEPEAHVLSRRKVLAIGGVVSGATLAGVFKSAQGAGVSYDEHHGMVMPRSQPWREVTDAPVTPFTVPMPLPSVLAPTSSSNGTDFYRIAIRTANAEI